ncbi:MAG: carbohydrate binding domain-containing protein [Phycisphaerales bacterium]
MLRTIRIVVFVLLFAQLAPLCDGRVYPCRWFFVSNSLRADKDVNEVEQIVRTASEHGLNGMLLTAGLDNLDRQPPEYQGRLAKVKATCDELGVEIIPCIFSIGYGWDVLTYNRNLAAGIPVNDVPFVVKAGEARLEASQSVRLANGGFEEHDGDRLKGYGFHDKPGDVSFVDSTVFHGGKASLRFEGFGRFEHGHGRVMQQIEVQPHRCYRVSCWVKTEALEPANSFHVLVLGEDGRDLAPYIPDPVAPGQWRRIVMGFNSLDRDKVNIYAGVWEGKAGRLWIDDFEVQEVALLNVLRRPGTPVTVRSERTGEVCEEGKDYGPIRDEQLNFRFDHESPAIKVLPGGRIQEGERLKISYYHGMGVNDGQVTACMSEPEVYEIWKKQAELIHRYLAPARYLLSMDEIRAGGSCQACKQRNLSMARILGDCVTKQVGILRQVNPKAEIFIWSDMLDPNHNAHGNYYLVDGDFTGSWEHVPKDLTIVCWYFDIRKESLGFFSSHGFKTLAGAYYDGDTLENPRGWLDVLDETPNAIGIMYTTWQSKYELLGPFGELLDR